MRLPRLLFLGALILVAGCDSSPEPEPPPDSLLPSDARYSWSLESRLIETDTPLFSERSPVRVRTVDTDASVPGYEGLIELETTGTGGAARTSYEYTGDVLREVAYRGAEDTPLAAPRGVAAMRGAAVSVDVFAMPRLAAERIALAEAPRAGTLIDSLIVRDDPRVVYELPLEVGASWVSFTRPFESVREVVGRERVTVEAGTFECFVIRTRISLRSDDRFEWLDYVSLEHGLVLRIMTSMDTVRDANNESLASLARTTERLERTGGR